MKIDKYCPIRNASCVDSCSWWHEKQNECSIALLGKQAAVYLIPHITFDNGSPLQTEEDWKDEGLILTLSND